KVGHKADMKGILINTLCKLEALYSKVSGGLGSFGLSIASRKKNDEDRKSLVLYRFIQDGLEINIYAMFWFEEIYLFGRINFCMVPSEKDNSYYLKIFTVFLKNS
ncbi:12850_t:CDS:2, partial [Dentiscutata heterogama]